VSDDNVVPLPIDLTPEHVADVTAEVVEQNNELIGQLQLLGRQPALLRIIQIELQALLDVVFADDDDARAEYELCCHLGLNADMKSALAQLTSSVQS